MKPEFVEVKLGNLPVKVPLVCDVETTFAVADRVNARLKEIEGQIARLDTQLFALLAAMAFASEVEENRRVYESHLAATESAYREELEKIEGEREQETKDILVALDKIVGALRSLAKTGATPLPKGS